MKRNRVVPIWALGVLLWLFPSTVSSASEVREDTSPRPAAIFPDNTSFQSARPGAGRNDRGSAVNV